MSIPWTTTIAIILIGWITGALLNYLADVLPLRRRLVQPFCLACGMPISIKSYFLWPRRCSRCAKSRPRRVTIVEGSLVVISVWLWLSTPPGLSYILWLILLFYLSLVAVIDLEHRIIMHPVSMIGVLLGLLIGTLLYGILDTIIGGVVGYATMLVLYGFGMLFSRFIARWRKTPISEEALGFGDVNLSGIIGLMLGWPGIILGLALAIVIGGIVSLLYLIFMLYTRRYQYFLTVPYGPFLVVATLILLFFRNNSAP